MSGTFSRGKDFSGWRCGLPFYGPVLALGVLLSCLSAWLGAVVTLLGVAMLLFFRDFPRVVTAGADDVVSPADGTITAIEDFENDPHYDGPCRRVSIFLSVFSAHINRAPFESTVLKVIPTSGKYLDARDPECSKHNVSNALWLETPRGPMTVRQITGAVARRIVCPAVPGDRLGKGEKFGMIRFGSRTELYLPSGTEVTVKIGEYVYAGLTTIARFK